MYTEDSSASSALTDCTYNLCLQKSMSWFVFRRRTRTSNTSSCWIPQRMSWYVFADRLVLSTHRLVGFNNVCRGSCSQTDSYFQPTLSCWIQQRMSWFMFTDGLVLSTYYVLLDCVCCGSLSILSPIFALYNPYLVNIVNTSCI